ncbi:ABC1 kinase family protein [Altericista sp. CCNU0014]|uniref:ABC1 kinase family protein n=1 Tax=Altericista sp. CCNU0014 TaxID=3082949 RepID=UPI00384E1EAF
MAESLLGAETSRNSTVLKRYDPHAISRYYRWRPWKVLWRSLQVAVMFAWFVGSIQLDKILNRTERNLPLRAMQLRKLLTNLGPTFIKIGQALSTRPDLVRQDYLEQLTLLQDQLPPFPTQEAFAIIERELNCIVEDAFQEISPKPVAAASLGQVYKGRLYNGQAVAIKVQRPNLEKKLTLDLFIIRHVVKLIGPWLPINLSHDLRTIVDEFGTKLFEEIDYHNEGLNAEQFARNFRDSLEVKVPAIYWKYSSRSVLTLEWIDGFKLSATQCILDANLESDNLIRIGVESGLRQLLEFGFFHADPHPGNLFVMPDGRMAYIDFGMMDQLNQETKETLVDALVHLVNKDYERLAQDFVRLGFLTPDTDITPIVPALECVFADVVGSSVGEFNFKIATDRFSDLMFQYPFRIPAKFALIIRSLVTQEGVALCLNPNFKIVEVSYPYIAKRLLTEESPAFRRRLIEVLFKDGKFQWERLENMIAIARSDKSFDLVPTAQMGLQYLFSEESQFLRRQIVLALTEDDRLHTTEVQRLWALIQPDLHPSKLVNAAFGALADFSGGVVANLTPWAAPQSASKPADAREPQMAGSKRL